MIKTFHEKYRYILRSGKKARKKDAPNNDKFLQFKVEADKLFDICSCKCKSNHRLREIGMDAFCHKNSICLETFCSDRKMRWIFLIQFTFHFIFRQLVKLNDISIGRKHRGRHLFWRTKSTTI